MRGTGRGAEDGGEQGRREYECGAGARHGDVCESCHVVVERGGCNVFVLRGRARESDRHSVRLHIFGAQRRVPQRVARNNDFTCLNGRNRIQTIASSCGIVISAVRIVQPVSRLGAKAPIYSSLFSSVLAL